MKLSAKVIKLNRTNFHDFIDDLVLAYDENRLTDFTAIGSYKYKEGEEIEDSFANIASYWFSGEGGSSINCIGLTEYMKQRILDYMKDD